MIGQRKRCEQFVRREEGLRANTCRPSQRLVPNANATVLLDLLLYRVIDDALNPLILNNSAVGPKTHCLKVLSRFHCGVLAEPSTSAILGDQDRAIGMLSPVQTPADFFGMF